MVSDSIRFVLFEPSHPGNIGAVARAMKTMGLSDLVLVNPADCDGPEASARASGAIDVLQSAQRVACLADAVRDCGLVVGASARHRRLGMPEMAPRECAEALLRAREGGPVAVVFGPERAGLSNAELDLCNAIVFIPANPAYSSLNLAAAAQVIAWEIRCAQGIKVEAPPPESPAATVEDMDLFYEHLQRVLESSGFLDPGNPRNLMRRLRRLFNRARLDQNELNILRGILAAVAPGSGERSWRGVGDPAGDGEQ
ncbi:MAG: RNA methyltransferase [Gammaproteobacteria bacterium]|nr:MAG: RNA methyltransferase [Gammaproteobacteria bacterium]